MIYFYISIAAIILMPWFLFLIGFVWTFFKRDGYNNRLSIMLAIDRLGNTLCGGEDEEYISTMLGRRYMERKRYAFWRAVVDLVWLVCLGQKDHCVTAYKKYGGE